MTRLYNHPDLKDKRRVLRRHQTDAERKLWQILRNQQLDGLKFFRQYSIGNYIVDFYCPRIRLAVEVDGGQHLDRHTDKARTECLLKEGITVLRFWNNEVLTNPAGVYEKIRSTISPLKIRGDQGEL